MSPIRDLAGTYGDAVIATLVVVVGGLFIALVRSHKAHVRDLLAFGSNAALLIQLIQKNDVTLNNVVGKLDDATDMLRVAYELLGKKPRRTPIATPAPKPIDETPTVSERKG